MRTRILTSFIFFLLTTTSFAQILPFGFVKNCMSFSRTTVTDELNKKQIKLIDRNYQKANNPLLQGSTYYSNEADRTPGLGEVAVLSKIDGSKQITEISFINGTKNNSTANFDDVYKQMVNFFKDERTFKSPKYNDVNYFTRDKVYYYVFKVKDVPTILVSNYKLEEDYFGKK
ncbi:MAG: hypothetical protein K0Q95_1703 [Bacteroidota bacterium]|nr:hypothetical protein [Bacteroidota bacterium]